MNGFETEPSDEPIFGRIANAIAAFPGHARIVLVGVAEWNALRHLCKHWGHDGWPPGGADYCPPEDESMRARINGCAIYRVDSAHFLSVL